MFWPGLPWPGLLRIRLISIGTGISGLACAKELVDNGETDFVVLEASDCVGGRVRTDEVNGYLLDRGFQVFIESYPESRKLFDYDALELRPLLPGALVRLNGDFHVVSDPFRRPQDLYASLISPIGSLTDKINVGIKSVLVRFKNLEDIFEENDETTAKYLEYTQGLSQNMIFRLNTKVISFSKGQVQAVDAVGINTIFKCQEVVLAVDPESFNRFLGDKQDFTIPEKRRWAFSFK